MLGAAHAAGREPADRPLRAVFPKQFPPVYTTTGNNVPGGFGIEFAEEIAERAGLQIEYRALPTWYDAQQALRDGEADLIPDMGVTPERQPYYDFTQVIHSIPISLFVRHDNTSIEGFDDLSGQRVGGVRSNQGMVILSRRPELQLQQYDSLNDLFVALLRGDIDAALYPEPNFRSLAIDLAVDNDIRVVGEPVAVIPRAMAVRKGDTELLARLNAAISDFILTREYRHLERRWFPPPPPFWDARRVAVLALAIMVLMTVGWQIQRLRALRRMNARLQAANIFRDAILDAASESIIALDTTARITAINRAAERVFGLPESALLGVPLSRLFPEVYATALERRITDYHARPPEKRLWDHQRLSDLTALRANGETFPVRVGLVPMDGVDASGFVCTIHDESREKRAESRARHLLHHDPLTGVLNQQGARAVLDTLIEEHAAPHLACLCVGLQRLSHINGVYGQKIGDRLLVEAATVIQSEAVDPGATVKLVARTGGERFIIVLPCLSREATLDVIDRLNRRLEEIRVAVNGDRETIQPDTHIGLAYFPEHAQTAEQLIYHAEIAFHYARDHGLETFHEFNPSESAEQSHAELALQRIRSALSADRVVLHFQPIKHIESGAIEHYEALLRMQDPGGGLIMPADIIPPAERFGLITRIDYRVMELAMTYLASWQEKRPGISLAVNLSASHLGNSILLSWMNRIVEANRVAARKLVFEITESAALENVESVKEFMQELKELGCRFALDDFGVGFTSFAQLRHLPVDIVKIDGVFIRELRHNVEDRTLVKAITDVAHSLGKTVVAEFVEDEATYEILREFGVDYAQGYFIGRPQPELLNNDDETRPLHEADPGPR